jgi:hypothetical protein
MFRYDRLRRNLLPLDGGERLEDGNLVAVKRFAELRRRLGGRLSWRFRRPGLGLW